MSTHDNPTSGPIFLYSADIPQNAWALVEMEVARRKAAMESDEPLFPNSQSDHLLFPVLPTHYPNGDPFLVYLGGSSYLHIDPLYLFIALKSMKTRDLGWTTPISKNDIQRALGLWNRAWIQWLQKHSSAIRPKKQSAKHISINLSALPLVQGQAIASLLERNAKQSLEERDKKQTQL